MEVRAELQGGFHGSELRSGEAKAESCADEILHLGAKSLFVGLPEPSGEAKILLDGVKCIESPCQLPGAEGGVGGGVLVELDGESEALIDKRNKFRFTLNVRALA